MKLVNGKRPQLREYLMIIAGTGLMALAINSVFDASGMVTGGFSGIAIIIKAGSQGIIDGGIPLWVTNMGLNIPLFLIGWKINGFSFVKKALIGEIALSTWLAIEPVWNLAGNDLLLAALYGGVIQGVGIGLVFLGGGTTGGTDMMAAIIQKYLNHYSIAQIMQFIDGAVVVVGMYVFGVERALYAIIAVFLVTKVSDGIIEGLKFKTSFNFDLINYNTLDYTNPKLGPAKENGGGVSRMNTRTFSWTWNNIATYDKTIGEHHFNVLAGVEAYSYRYDELTASRSKMAQPDMPELVVGSQLTGGSGYRIDYALVGYLTQALYDYQNKYFFSASYRRDGSSRFAPETRWGNFWSLGTSWRIDREEFMASTSDWLSALTLKMSYGAQGNDNLGTYYASKGLYTIVSNLGENALVSDRMATPNLKWETNLNFNVGIDFSLFNNRFSGSFDFFTRRSKDLLYSRPIAPSLGYGSIDENVGALKNTGIEMVLNGTIINQNGWVWKLGMNLTHYKNKVTDLPLKDMPQSGVNKLQVGRSVYDFYMIEWAGVDPENGDPLWYMDEEDENHNPTGKRVTTNDYGSADYYYVNKSSLPKVYGGFNTSLSWKGFDLSAIFAYSIGGYIYNRDITMILHNGSLEGRDWSTEILKRWTPDNRNTDVPALSTTTNNWNSASTRFLQNNSYMRLKNLTLSYNLPKQWISKLSLSSVQVYVQGDNLFTIHRNQGLDPEQGITGITYYRYPAMRTISGGINVSF